MRRLAMWTALIACMLGPGFSGTCLLDSISRRLARRLGRPQAHVDAPNNAPLSVDKPTGFDPRLDH